MLAGTAIARESSGPEYGIYAYTGREWDPETNLYYYRARYYDPKIGRFISEDPTALDHERTQKKGRAPRYEYVANTPVRYVDPDGRSLRNPLTWWREIKCAWKKEQCNRAVWKYCKCEHPYSAPKKGRPTGGTEYRNCVNEGVMKCCEVFYQLCRAGKKKALVEEIVKPQCPDDPAFDPYR